MARRRTPVPRAARGEGMIALQGPIARLLESGVGVETYLRLVRDGSLDVDHRHERMGFDSRPEAVKVQRERRRLEVPEHGLPDMHGLVTWRRAERRWSLDVAHAALGGDTHYWSQATGGDEFAQVRFDGVRLSETTMTALPGRALRDLVDHPLFDDSRIVVVDGTTGGPYPDLGVLPGRPAMTQLRITVPIELHPDPPADVAGLARNDASTL